MAFSLFFQGFSSLIKKAIIGALGLFALTYLALLVLTAAGVIAESVLGTGAIVTGLGTTITLLGFSASIGGLLFATAALLIPIAFLGFVAYKLVKWSPDRVDIDKKNDNSIWVKLAKSLPSIKKDTNKRRAALIILVVLGTLLLIGAGLVITGFFLPTFSAAAFAGLVVGAVLGVVVLGAALFKGVVPFLIGKWRTWKASSRQEKSVENKSRGKKEKLKENITNNLALTEAENMGLKKSTQSGKNVVRQVVNQEERLRSKQSHLKEQKLVQAFLAKLLSNDKDNSEEKHTLNQFIVYTLSLCRKNKIKRENLKLETLRGSLELFEKKLINGKQNIDKIVTLFVKSMDDKLEEGDAKLAIIRGLLPIVKERYSCMNQIPKKLLACMDQIPEKLLAAFRLSNFDAKLDKSDVDLKQNVKKGLDAFIEYANDLECCPEQDKLCAYFKAWLKDSKKGKVYLDSMNKYFLNLVDEKTTLTSDDEWACIIRGSVLGALGNVIRALEKEQEIKKQAIEEVYRKLESSQLESGLRVKKKKASSLEPIPEGKKVEHGLPPKFTRKTNNKRPPNLSNG